MTAAGGRDGGEAEVVRLEVPADPEYLALIRMVVATTARLDPLLDEDRVDDLRIVVYEACINAIEAMLATGPPESGTPPVIAVECRLGPSQLEVIIDDAGEGFDPADLATLPAASDPERLSYERGLGLPLIRALADEVEITSGPRGTTVRVALYSDPDGLDGLA